MVLHSSSVRVGLVVALLAAFGITVVALIVLLGLEAVPPLPLELLPALASPLPLALTPASGALSSPTTGEVPLCTDEYAPVCGVNGRTYANRCVAEAQAKVSVRHDGPCRPDERSEELAPI